MSYSVSISSSGSSGAGPTGYWLHRKLIEIGIVNYVVCPTCLDVRRSGVNNDKSDALELATRLDRYLAGNHKYFSIVTVPSEIIEQKRARKRAGNNNRRCTPTTVAV